MKEWKAVFLFLLVLLMPAQLFSAPVPDTGQTKCYDVAGNEIPCPSPGEDYYGQDANYSINPPSYTKLDSNGNTLSDFATSWAMVKDNVTGLIWEVKTVKDAVTNYSDPHDADNTYTWYFPNDPVPGTAGKGTDTQDFITALNNAQYGGHNDWRLPTITELSFLIRYDIPLSGPATTDLQFFPSTQENWYWSSTPHAGNTANAWYVDFEPGYGQNSGKSNSCYVRAVRGGQAGIVTSHYQDNGNDTVTDTSTGLTWMKYPPDSPMTWEQTLSYCENLSLGGYSDWRLPSIKELRSLKDYSRHDPSIDTDYFPNTVSSYWWTSTTYVTDTKYSRFESFFPGEWDDGGLYKEDQLYVRAVRGGQSGSSGNLSIWQSPSTGSVGTVFIQEGKGFTPNSTATLHFKKPDGTEYLTQQQAIDAIGHFEVSYTAPLDKPTGTYAWWAMDGVTKEKSNEISYQITSLSSDLTVQTINPQSSESFYNNFFPNPDPSNLTTGGSESTQIAADGQSRLLLRLIATSNPGQIIISVQGNTDENGTLSTLENHVTSSYGSSVDVNLQQYGSLWIGFAVYRAPIDFAISGYENKLTRPVKLNVSSDGTDYDPVDLTLRRPPILISHGLWSYVWGNEAIESFRNTLWERFTDRSGLNIANYIWLNDCFYENAREVDAGRDKTRSNIRQYLAFVRSHGDTVTQVDYLGHSMGGQWGRLVEQKFPKDTFTYDNGYFHKLITLDTPHGGSFIADIGQFLLDNAAYIRMPGLPSVRDYICWITAEFQSPVCSGAIEDLTSAGSIENLKEISVPSHAIMGNTPIDTACYLLSASEWATGYSVVKFIKLAEKLLKTINPEYGCENWFNQFDFTTNTDFVVDVHSQQGGLSGSQLNEYEHQHTSSFNSDVNACFFDLLNKSVNDSAYAAGFPATHTWWNNQNFMSLMAEINPPAILKNAEPLGEIQFINPVDGSTIQPGQQVTVTLTTTGSLTLANVMIMAAGSDTIELTQAPFTTVLTVPDDAYDSFVISVLGEGSDSNLYQASVTLMVNNDAVLQKVDVNPQSLYLDMGAQLNLTVTGSYSDGTIRDLSSGSKGTTYKAGDESILSVSVDGLITPKSIGIGFVQVSPASSDPVIVRVETVAASTTKVGTEAGFVTITLPADEIVELVANSTNNREDTPQYEWLIFTAYIGGTSFPIYLISDSGMFDVTQVIDSLYEYTFSFDSDGLTTIAILSMSDLGLSSGDNFVYAYAYQNQSVTMIIDNIVSIIVQ